MGDFHPSSMLKIFYSMWEKLSPTQPNPLSPQRFLAAPDLPISVIGTIPFYLPGHLALAPPSSSPHYYSH